MNIFKGKLFFFIPLLTSICLQAQNTVVELIDLQPRWQMYHDNRFENFNNASSAIHFQVSSSERYDTLIVSSPSPFSVFVDNKWHGAYEKKLKMGLSNSFAGRERVMISILFDSPPKTYLQRHRIPDPMQLRSAGKESFTNFTQIASVIVLIFFIVMLNTNSKLMSDYLSVRKLLMLNEREENVVTQRASSSINFVFYLLASTLWALIFMILMHHLESHRIGWQIKSDTLGEFLLNWFVITLIVFFVITIKMVATILLSALFKMKETAGFQFFLFIRLLMVIGAMAGFILVLLYTLNVDGDTGYFNLFVILAIVTGIGCIITFFKLMHRVSYHFFHLFSYLCASEIIPFLILVKVLFK